MIDAALAGGALVAAEAAHAHELRGVLRRAAELHAAGHPIARAPHLRLEPQGSGGVCRSCRSTHSGPTSAQARCMRFTSTYSSTWATSAAARGGGAAVPGRARA